MKKQAFFKEKLKIYTETLQQVAIAARRVRIFLSKKSTFFIIQKNILINLLY